MTNLLSRLFNSEPQPAPILPTPDTFEPRPVAPVEPVTDPLPPIKNWSHPFRDRRDPLQQLTPLANAISGCYPLGGNGLWHGGVHFDGGTAATFDQSSVHCIADGEVVAYRIDQHAPTTRYFVNTLPVDLPFSRNFVLVRHRLQPPQIDGNPDAPPSLTFYSLYMHLQDWAVYEADSTLARPGFWCEGSTRYVREDVKDLHGDYPGQHGLNVRSSARHGKVLGLLPRGAEVVISGEGDYRKLENTPGPERLQAANGSLRGFVAARFLTPIAGGQHRVECASTLNVRSHASVQGNRIYELPDGTEVTVSGEGEYRRLERVNQYVHDGSLRRAPQPQARDAVVVLDTPMPIKAGELIGHLGLHQDIGTDRPDHKLHLEVFSGDTLKAFIEQCRLWADKLPASSKTSLKLVKGTAVVSHQASFTTKQPPSLKATSVPSDAELLIPKRVLDNLPADRKITVAASRGHNACNWYRLQGLLHDAEHTVLDGWVCEEVGVTPWVSPWSWDGHDILFNCYTPRHLLASFMRATGQLRDDLLEKHNAIADSADQGPIKTRLYDIIDRNRDGQITAAEINNALCLPAHAQSISQLIIHTESEWHHTDHKWDQLDELLGHSGSTPHLNWLAEKQRIKEHCWWGEVAGKLGLPGDGKVYHLHPVGLLGRFTINKSDDCFPGKITFDAEGDDTPSSRYYSRVLHWPGNSLSGVTIGRGYDLGNRNREEVYNDLTEAGVSDEIAHKISLGHGLKGDAAKDFVNVHKAKIGQLTAEQQISLFMIIYPLYVERARSNYNKWTRSEVDAIGWDRLDQVIRDVLVDFVYQGFTTGPNPMMAGMHNSKEELIAYIENTPGIKRHEPGRRRVAYINKKSGG